MLTEACGACCVVLGLSAISLRNYTVCSWGEFAGMSTPVRIGVCFECLPFVNNLPHCRMMDFKFFGNGRIILPRLMAATIASLR